MNKIKPRTLFLIDSLGGLLSAILLGLVLPVFETVFPLPKDIFCLLAFIAAGFFIYSLLCFIIHPKNWRVFMKFIATLNLLYVGLTSGVLIFFRNELTLPCLAYFIGEMFIIVGLAISEFKKAR